MKVSTSYQVAGIYALVITCLVSATAVAPASHAQSAPLAKPGATSPGPQETLLRQMVGTWNVEPRMWTGPNAEPIKLPAAVARRRLVGGMFLEEVMEAASGSGQDPFTRIAHFNYNQVTQRYEANSMDTRGPQMMYEKSYEDSASNAGQKQHVVKFYLEDNFVLPQWGNTANAAFKGRKVIEIEKHRQVVRLYWTPLTGESAREFLATEYVYTRQR